MRYVPALLAAALLAGPAIAQSDAAPYRALGTEPFWSLTIDGRALRLEVPGRAATGVARPSFNGTRYVTPQMTVDVTRTACSDGMSDRRYPETVTVQVGRRTLRGCGGAAAARSVLADTRWTVDTIDGRKLRTKRSLTVDFAADRVEGRLCNRFAGRYERNGKTLRIDDVTATRMVCQGAPQLAESTLFRMWRGPVRATVSRWGTLILARGGATVTLRPVR